MVRPALAAVVAALTLAGCDRPAQAPAPTPAETAPPPAIVAAPPAPAGWRLEASATAGVALAHANAAGETQLRLACRRAPDSLYAEWPGVTRIESEDRLTLGAGDQLAVLVVAMDGSPEGLRAEGQPDADFVAALAAGRALSLSYGARQIALPAPSAETRAAFAAACFAAR